VFEIPGVVGTSLALDYMHNMFLGWLQYLYGSIMYMLVFVVMGGSDMENLTAIAAFIKKDQKARGTTHKYRPRLDKLSMFKKKKSYPRLRGRAADIMGLYDTMLAPELKNILCSTTKGWKLAEARGSQEKPQGKV
jgi:hypothetical protein